MKDPEDNNANDNSDHVNRETVDINIESRSLTTYSEGSLEYLDGNKRIGFKWFKAKAILLLSTGIICSLIFASLLILGFSDDEDSRNWARQILTALMGFAAGSIWTSSQGNKSEED